jgi:hypothetical protein
MKARSDFVNKYHYRALYEDHKHVNSLQIII